MILNVLSTMLLYVIPIMIPITIPMMISTTINVLRHKCPTFEFAVPNIPNLLTLCTYKSMVSVNF